MYRSISPSDNLVNFFLKKSCKNTGNNNKILEMISTSFASLAWFFAQILKKKRKFWWDKEQKIISDLCWANSNGILNWKCTRTTDAQWSPFYHQNPKNLCLGRQFGQINFGAFGIGFEFGQQRIRDLAIVCP